MIKKVLFTLGFVTFGVMMLTVSAFRAMADENILGVQTISTNPVVDEKQAFLEQENNYYLAYPGILPDHPIYWLKMARDKMVEVFTSDRLKKTGVWMDFADKRLGAAKVLVEGNQVDLGVQTATKANGYLAKAVLLMEELKKQGENVGDIANKMERETLKHAQILNQLGMMKSGDASGKLNGLRDEAIKLHERVEVVLGR